MQLTDGATTVSLPDNVLWRDELEWEPVAQATERTLTGALVTDESARTGGRPITLTGMWVTRAVIDKLETLRANVATDMTLTLPGGATKTVAWRRGDGPAEGIELVDERGVDNGASVVAAGLVVRLQGDAELVPLEVTAAGHLAGSLPERGRAHPVEDAAHVRAEVLVQQLFALRAVTGREHTVAGLIHDRQRSRVDKFGAKPLYEKALHVLQRLAGADDDGDPLIVEFGEQMQRLAGYLVVRTAGRPERLVHVEDEHVHSPALSGPQLGGRQRCLPVGECSDVGVLRAEYVRDTTDAAGEVRPRRLPATQCRCRVDRGKQLNEIAERPQRVGVVLVVEPVQPLAVVGSRPPVV